MARKRKDKGPRYKWGYESPGPRIRTACDKTREALAQVDAPGFHHIAKRVDAAVQAAHPLAETMEHAARAGLRTAARSAATVPGADVAAAVRAANEAVGALLESSASTQSARFEAFVEALNHLMTLADTGIEHGIEGTGASDPDDPWKAFGV